MSGPSFREAVRDHARALRDSTDSDLRALAVACLAELARRDGATVAATWAEDQSTRLRSLDGATG